MRVRVTAKCYGPWKSGDAHQLLYPGDVFDYLGDEDLRPDALEPCDDDAEPVVEEVTGYEPTPLSAVNGRDAEILAACQDLDPDDDAHWTNAGHPSMDALNDRLDPPVTRNQVKNAAPGFARPA